VVAFHFLAFFLKKKENGTFAGLKPHSASPMPLPHHADHKTAISNHHLQQISEQHTTFRDKDYKTNGFRKQMILRHGEFIRRFARIRHYGILSSTWKRVKFAALKQRLNIPLLQHDPTTKLHHCPCCKTGILITIAIFGKRGPPQQHKSDENTASCYMRVRELVCLV
jgi:Putative transposase